MEEPKDILNETTENTSANVENVQTETAQNEPIIANQPDTTEVAQPAATEETTPAEQPAPMETPAESAAEVAVPVEHSDEVAAETAESPADETPSAEGDEENEPQAEQEPEVDYSSYNREALIEALKVLLQEADITKIKNRVAAIKDCFNTANREVQKAAFDKFIEEGGNKDDYQGTDDAVADEFHHTYNIYRERRQKHIDEMEAAKQQNLEQKKQILDDLRQLIDSENETLKQSYDRFNEIQERWKAIGDVPRTEVTGLWQNYHFLVEQFFNKVKINKELMLLDQKKNLEQKTLLCEKAEELIVEPSITKAAKELQSLREQWREIGPVPAEQNDEIWARFRNAAGQIDERRREYYEQRHEELEKNLLAKQALVEKVKELTAETPATIKAWTDTSTALDELLKVWKSIGPVPREQNEEIWSTFKGTIDKFFSDKKAHFATIKDEQNDNYNKKMDLCLQAEAIALRDDWKKATEELLDLQRQWKEIGPVNRKMSERLWQRFRGACDQFFNKKSEYFSTLRSSEQDNLQKKEAILAELKETAFGDDKEENLTKIKDFQRRWMEAGHVPIAEKDRLQKDFRDTINKLFEQLKISAREAEANAYRERIRHNVGNNHAMAGERSALTEQIEKLQNDIKLWENNLGFLASSKQADLLKSEFEKKMQSARQQIALLHAKLRILDDAKNDQPADEQTDAPAGE